MQVIVLALVLGIGCTAVDARLSAPNVAAVAASSSAIDVTWTDRNSAVIGFVIERSLPPRGRFTQIATTPGDAEGYRDGGLAASTTYAYRVRALQERRSRSGRLRSPKKSPRSKVASALTLAAGGPAPQPTPTAAPPGAGGAGRWPLAFGGTATDLGSATAVDAAGNVVVTGRFMQTANFGGGTQTSAGGFDVFLAKYGPDGRHLWSKRFGGAGEDLGNAVAVDASGNVIVAGSFERTVSFGGGGLASAGSWDIFLAKYGPDGTHQWSKRFGGGDLDSANAVAVDATGAIVLGGSFKSTVGFGGTPLSTSRSVVTDLFVAKYSAAGAHQWSRGFEADGTGAVNAVAVDDGGNVAVTGFFDGSVRVGGVTLASFDFSRDVLVARLSAAGAPLWARRFGEIRADHGAGVAMDGAGNVLVTGQFGKPVDFGGGMLSADAAGDVFVAKYAAATGAHLWSESLGGTQSTDAGAAIAFDTASDAVVVTGSFQGTADFGGAPLVGGGRRDVFVAAYAAATGAQLWSTGVGNGGNDQGNGVAVGPAGRVVVTGYFAETVDFGARVLTSGGDLDAFLLALTP